jgi:periplasmic protein TonB
MRTLLFSAALALVFHALLFTIGAGSLQNKVLLPTNKMPLSISIDYLKPSINSAPLSAKAPEPERHPETLRTKIEKNLAPVKPKIRKPAVTKKVQSPSKPKEKVQDDAGFSRLPSRDFAPAMTDAGSGSQDKKAVVPSGQVSGSSLTTAALPPVEVREAVPVYRINPAPEYPSLARRRGYEGTVVIEAFVDREGRVQDLRLYQSSGHEVLDRAAMQAVKGWLFEPARRGRDKIEMWVKVPLSFRLE